MKIFNKKIALLVVTSFIASDNIYAGPRNDDLENSPRNPKRIQAKTPKKYDIKISDMPDDLKEDMRALHFKEEQQLTIEEMRKYFNDVQKIEKMRSKYPPQLSDKMVKEFNLTQDQVRQLKEIHPRSEPAKNITQRLTAFLQEKHAVPAEQIIALAPNKAANKQLPVKNAKPGVKPVPRNAASKQLPVKSAKLGVKPAPRNAVNKQLPVKGARPGIKTDPRNAVNKQLPVKGPKPGVKTVPRNTVNKQLPVKGARPGIKPVPRNTMNKQLPVKNAKPGVKTAPNNIAKNGNVAGRARAKSMPLPNNAERNGNLAGRPRAQSTPIIPNNNTKRVNVARVVQIKNTPIPNNYYTIKASDFSDDLKKDLKNFLAINSSENHKWSQKDLQDRFALLEDVEKQQAKTPDPVWTEVGLRTGTTQRLRNAFKAKYGYEEGARAATPGPSNPAKGGNVARITQTKNTLIPDNNAKKVAVAKAVQPKLTSAANNTANKVNVAKAGKANAKKAVPTPVNNPKKTPAKGSQTKGPQYYVLKTKRLPKDLKKDLEVFGYEEDEDIIIKEHKLRKALNDMDGIEATAPGVTERSRQHLSSIGYNPNGVGKVRIVASKLPKEFKDIISILQDDDLPAIISLSQAEATEMLNDIEECETLLRNKPGLVGRIRAFLKKQYGFKG